MIRDFLNSKKSVAVDKYLSVDASFPYPNPNISPEEKGTKGYTLAQAHAFYYEFLRNQLAIPYTWDTNEGGVIDFKTLRAYSNDNQPVDKYKKMLGFRKNPDSAQPSRTGGQQLSWDIKSPCRRYVDGIKGAMSSIKHAVIVKAVDEFSQESLAEQKYRMLALKKNAKYHEINQKLNLQSPIPPVKFGDEEELDIIMKTDQRFEQTHAIALKTCLVYSMEELSNFPEIESQLLEDQLVLGWACAHVSVDNITNKAYAEYIDAEVLLVPNSANRNYSDIDRGGHIKLLNFVDFCREAKAAPDGGPTFEQLCKIGSMYSGNRYTEEQLMASLQNINGGGVNYAGSLADRIKIPVMFFEWKEWNQEKRIYREREGNPNFVKKVDLKYKPNGKEKVLNTNYEAWYRGVWVVGTDYLINWGPLPYTEAKSGGKTKCRYKVYKTAKKSIVAQMIPTLDAKQILWLKYQDAWIKSRPPGMDINVSALVGVKDKDGKDINALDVITRKTSSGIGLYYQTFNRNDPKFGQQGPPFTYDDGSVGVIVEQYAQNDAVLDADLTKTTGITENMLGTEAKPNQLVQVTEMLIAGTHNRLQPVYNGVFQIKKEVIEGLCCQIQNLAAYVPKGEPFYPEISEFKKAALRIGRDSAKYQFGVSIKIVASDSMKQIIVATIAESQAKGILSPSDGLRVFEMVENGFYEEAQRYLSYKEKKAAEMQAENEQAMMKANAEMQAAAAKQAEDAKLASKQAEGSIEERLLKMQAELKILTDNNASANKQREDDNKYRNELIMQKRDLEVDREKIQADKEKAKKEPV